MYLDNILVYTEDDRNANVIAVWWVLEQLKKFLLYANLKKCWFYQDEVQFLGYVLFLKSIHIKDKQ